MVGGREREKGDGIDVGLCSSIMMRHTAVLYASRSHLLSRDRQLPQRLNPRRDIELLSVQAGGGGTGEESKNPQWRALRHYFVQCKCRTHACRHVIF